MPLLNSFLIKETFFYMVWFDDLFLNAIECIMVDKQKNEST